MPRTVAEWRGKTPDQKPPRRVVMRVFERHEGRCYLTGRKIRPGDEWQTDHIIALCNGGENRESNLAPALTESHRKKTTLDVKAKSKATRVRAKHLGIRKPSRMAGSRDSRFRKKVDGTVVDRESGEPIGGRK